MPGNRRLQAAAAALLAVAGVMGAVGCASHCPQDPGKLGKKVVLQRGRSAQGRPWQLSASEQGGQLGLFLESPTGHDYSGGIGFCSAPAAGFWLEGLGPHGSTFYYGPAPAAAVTARLTASGHAAIQVPTRPLPHRAGLPRSRYFITQPPGPATIGWNVTLLDAAGHKVPFADS
ncbi:MAG: hypothetical protein J2P35_03025 [Actinobacteria bacterium]|nr:hypothetical protein [Actinomycetota bacterium]MBO0785362.1 hypothetical protein [Actinomycetota bacterium]MBO0813898.1 hypothetical protein [Actinomycetota bacterium]